MKKILFLLVLIYNFAFSANTTFSYVAQMMSGYNYTTDNSGYSYPIWQSGSAGGLMIFWKSSTRILVNTNSPRAVGSDPCIGSVSVNLVNGKVVCSGGSFNEALNPDPLGGSECRDLFQKDGVAYTCNPNTNEATSVPYSNGVTIDPEDGKDVPNCNEGYSYDTTINFPNQGTTSGGYNSYTCLKDPFNPDGSFLGDNGTIIGADGSITTPNPAGGSTTVFLDGSTSTIHQDGTITTTPPTTPPPTDSGTGTTGSTGGTGSTSGSTTGGTSGTGTTGGTTGTDTGSGSTGGTTGTTDTGGTSGTGTTGGTTSGTTGTDTGTSTEPTTGADNCTDSNMTLLEKTLCKVNNSLNTLPTDGGQAFSDKFTGVSSGADGSNDGFMTFISDMRSSYNTFANQITNTRQFFQEGFTFNPIRNIVNSNNLEQCLTISVFGGQSVFMDFITPLIYIKPITSLIFQIFMLIEVLRMCFLIINYTRSIF